MGGTDAQLEGEVRSKSMEAVSAEEAPGESEKRASEKGGGESEVRVVDKRARRRMCEVGWTESVQCREDCTLEERPGPYQCLQRWNSVSIRLSNVVALTYSGQSRIPSVLRRRVARVVAPPGTERWAV